MKSNLLNDIIVKIEESLFYDCDLKQEHDKNNNTQLWVKLKNKSYILCIAQIVRDFGGRCIVVSSEKIREICTLVYHFDIKNILINVEIELFDNKIDSITPILQSADWTERELRDVFDINFIKHPNLKRIFLEKNMHKKILDSYMPLSKVMLGDMSNNIIKSQTNER